MHSTFSTRNTNEYSEPTILWRNACNWVYTTCKYRRVLWALRKPVLFFIFLRAANKNADAERERTETKAHTYIFTYSVESVTTMRCRRMDGCAGARALIWSEMRGKNTRKNSNKIARAREMIISLFRMPLWLAFLFRFSVRSDRSTVLSSWHTKNDYFCFFLLLLFISYMLFLANPDQR